MNLATRKYTENDLPQMIQIWNEIVEEGIAFPQEELLTIESGKDFFASQTYTGVAVDSETGQIYGLYILHPNNIGRCGHLSNASYAVKSSKRGLHIGEALVKDCLVKAKELGFKVLQFNAVVKSNVSAIKLYKKLGFVELGIVPEGYLLKDGNYEDIVLFYYKL